MITAEDIQRINETLETTEIKGNPYVMVAKRVNAFRKLCPMGTIETQIISLENGIVTMKAIVSIDGTVVSTGYAQEKETSSYINKTSFIENCETSAVGRALGFLGIGVGYSMASADELVNALSQQEMLKGRISIKEQKILQNMIEKAGYKVEEFLNIPIKDITGEQYLEATATLQKMLEAKDGRQSQ